MSTKTSLESLQKEYCPPLDEALFFALALDFDVEDPEQAVELRRALDSLKESAVVEQELELLPPVSDGADKPLEAGTNENHATGTALSQHTTEDGTPASIATGLSSLGISDSTSQEHDALYSSYGEAGESFEDLSPDDKVYWLLNMFPSISKPTIEKVLARCDSQFDRTTDELLNEAFFKDSGIDAETHDIPIAKGIEGFISESDASAKRNRKGRNRRARNMADHDSDRQVRSESAHLSGTTTPDTNVWASAPKDIELLTSRTTLQAKLATSIYHANGARLAPTVRAILTKEVSVHKFRSDQVEEVIMWQIDELKTYFESLPDEIIYAALMLTRRSPSAAKELLDAMTTSDEEPKIIGKVNGLATYAPLDLSDGEDIRPKGMRYASQWTDGSGGGYTLSHMDNAHGLAAASAFNQASAAYKKGKSDRLMGGAAAYYASVGHEHVKAAKASQMMEADAHVARQSSSTMLDLHGVNVSHAVRIAQNATAVWWDSLGDSKYILSSGAGAGYRIVTGVGRHSADGVGKIGPAVSRMLVREGWKVEVGQGQIIVVGRARRK